MHIRMRLLTTAATAAVLVSAASANESPDPRGVWIDHTGRGAVEIVDCDGALCGRVVWLKDAKNEEACGVQILGDVQPAGRGVWDKGWIYDPEQDAKFSVELKPVGADKLRVLGYLGTKLFSETMVWQRAPADLQRCSTEETTAALAPADRGAASAPEAPGPESSSLPKGASDQREQATEERAETPGTPPEQNRAEPEQNDRAAAAGAKECKISMPYFTLSFPCPD